ACQVFVVSILTKRGPTRIIRTGALASPALEVSMGLLEQNPLMVVAFVLVIVAAYDAIKVGVRRVHAKRRLSHQRYSPSGGPSTGPVQGESTALEVISEFKNDLEAHGGQTVQRVNFSADLCQPYRDRIAEHFENAGLTIDRYHLIQLLNRALDDVR